MKPDPRLPNEGVNYTATNPLREAIVLTSGLIAVGLVFLSIFIFFIHLIIPMIPVSWEVRFFSSFSFLTEASSTEDERTARLEKLLSRLASHWQENPYTLRIGILESDQPNALALPGGQILVTSGLMDDVKSENELAFVLAHEIGHFRNRDHLQSLGRGVALALMMAAIGGGGTAADIIELGGNLSARKFGRDQERSADAFALQLVYQEYGHVSGAREFFEHLPKPEGSLERNLRSYLSTHPISEDRINDLTSLARENHWPTEGITRPHWK